MNRELTPLPVLTWIAWPLFFLGLLACLSHAAHHFHLLPRSVPMGDADRVILSHQAITARSAPAYRGLILGDSSGLMNLDAVQLSQELQTPVLNLSLLSYVDFHAMGVLLETYLRNHQAEWVLLVLHPEALRRPSPSEYHQNYLLTLLQTSDSVPSTPYSLPDRLLGTVHFRESIWETHCPIPLKGSFGTTYGFTRDFHRYLTLHQGSARDPRQENVQQHTGSSEYWISETWIQQANQLLARLPTSLRWFVVLSPIPDSFAPRGYSERYLKEWGEWNAVFSGPQPLSQLPATLPADHFATHTHLTPKAQETYTRLVSDTLKPLLGSTP